MYRDVQHLERSAENLQLRIRSAILSADIREANGHLGEAQATIDQLLLHLREDIGHSSPDRDEMPGTQTISIPALSAAQSSLNNAWNLAERAGMAEGIDDMRGSLVDMLIQSAFALAYIRTALGIAGKQA